MIQELKKSIRDISADVDALIPQTESYEGNCLSWRIHQQLSTMTNVIKMIEAKGVSASSRHYLSECNQNLNGIDSLLESYRG